VSWLVERVEVEGKLVTCSMTSCGTSIFDEVSNLICRRRRNKDVEEAEHGVRGALVVNIKEKLIIASRIFTRALSFATPIFTFSICSFRIVFIFIKSYLPSNSSKSSNDEQNPNSKVTKNWFAAQKVNK
jgi:hypothetical protein